MSVISPLVLSGLFAGIVMGLVAMALGMIGFTTLNLTQYLGCLLTGKKFGPLSFMAGFIGHIVASIMFAYVYIHTAMYLNLPLTMKTALILASINTVLSGTTLKLMDAIHPCVRSKALPAMNFFAYGYGTHGVITYVLVHYVYAITLFVSLGVPLSL